VTVVPGSYLSREVDGENPGRLRRTPPALARQAVAGRRPVRP
ncbi:succinyldiaminopimelate transaminase, partial [Pseudomonas aeruginosa]|nr:succinyldiaminopimelate transaminase [Pseudomonas aeruginosa]